MSPLSSADLQAMLRHLWEGRILEETIVDLCRQGRLGAHHSGVGHEAIGVGVAYGLRPDDAVQGSHRSGVTLHLARGDIRPRDVLFAQFGKGGQSGFGPSGSGGPRYLRAVGLVGSQLPMAAGAALADKLRGNDSVTVAFFGDGAANEGAVHEGMNLAGAWKLPIIFLVENNGFAISMPVSEATAAQDYSARASGYGMPGVTVDGNNLMAIYETIQEAAARARAGNGPTLVEVKIIRWEGHFTADPDTYRSDDVRAKARADDAIVRFRGELTEQGVLSQAEADAIEQEVRAEVEQAVVDAEAAPAKTAEVTADQLRALVWAP